MKTRFKYWNWQALVPQLLAALVLFMAFHHFNEKAIKHYNLKLNYGVTPYEKR